MNEKKKTSGRPKSHSEPKAPVVKEVKVEEVAKEDDDKGLIVLIAIAILIIIGTVIGLLVGCQKEEDENKTPEENKTDVIVPITDNKSDEEDGEEDYVIKTTSSTTTTKYQITYILDGKKVYSANLSSGSKIKKYVPSGYDKCTYYKDSEHSENFDFSITPTDDTKVYLVCNLKEYTVTYKDSDGSEISSETLIGTDTEGYAVDGNSKENFLGWSTDGSNKIAYKSGAKIDVNDDITLTAVYGVTTVVYKSIVVQPPKGEMEVQTGDEANLDVNETLDTNETIDVNETPAGDVVVDEAIPEEVPSEENNYGYSSNVRVDNTVEVGYTAEEVENYTLPSDPSEVGLETPTYFVPVEEETDTSKRIVSDDTEEVGDKQIRLGDVEGRTPDWYTPAVDDNVEEKDCEFQGWSEPSDYKPSTSGDNKVDAVYTIPEEDQNPPTQNNNNDNAGSAPAEVAPEAVVNE